MYGTRSRCGGHRLPAFGCDRTAWLNEERAGRPNRRRSMQNGWMSRGRVEMNRLLFRGTRRFRICHTVLSHVQSSPSSTRTVPAKRKPANWHFSNSRANGVLS